MKPGFQGLAFPKQTEKDRFIITLLSTLLSVCEAIVLFHRSTLFSKGLFLHSNSLIPPTLSPSAASFVFFCFSWCVSLSFWWLVLWLLPMIPAMMIVVESHQSLCFQARKHVLASFPQD